MARKAKKKARNRQRSTEWNVGQPLAFPSKKGAAPVNRVTEEIVEEAVRRPFRTSGKRKKK
jgi:hypothetical protein